VDNHSAAPAGGEPGAVHVLVDEGVTHVVMSGEIDSDLAQDLQQAAADAAEAGQPVRVDTRQVTFMDSAGLAFIARLCRGPERLQVVVGSSSVRFLLEVTGVSEAVDIIDGEGDDTPAGDTADART
jgi:anti-sigma B factor antagonist